MDDFIQNILTSPEFATFVLTTFTTVVGGAVAFIVREVRALLRNKLTAQQLETLTKIAEQAVLVVEQTNLGAAAEAKKAEAIRVAGVYLRAYGLRVSDEQLSAAIEAAVFSQLNQFSIPAAEIEAGEEVVEEDK